MNPLESLRGERVARAKEVGLARSLITGMEAGVLILYEE